MRTRKILALSTAVLTVLGMSACSASSTPDTASSSSSTAVDQADSKVQVFASTSVWASVARYVTGEEAEVVSSITDPGQDPHDYQASAKDKKLINDSKIAIINGGGYDSWALQMIESAPNKPVLIDAVELSGLKPDDHEAEGHDHDHEAEGHDHDHEAEGHDHDHEAEGGHHHHHHHGDFNEHVFYSLATVQKVADKLAADLSSVDPEHSTEYQANLGKFTEQLQGLKTEAEARAAKGHIHALATEPVVGYLLQDMDIHDITPPEFVEQSETEAGPSVKVQDEVLKLLTEKQVQVLILNAQTEDPISDKIQEAAQAADIPVVKVYETLPKGVDNYLTWIKDTISSLSQAVDK